MNLTLSIDEETLEKARKAAKAQGKSVNQMVREYLQQITRRDELQNVVATFRDSSRQGHSRGSTFARDELHERT